MDINEIISERTRCIIELTAKIQLIERDLGRLRIAKADSPNGSEFQIRFGTGTPSNTLYIDYNNMTTKDLFHFLEDQLQGSLMMVCDELNSLTSGD